MDGPRSLRKEEVDSLSRLMDTVFRDRVGEDIMLRQFPQLVNEENFENLLVYADGDKIVSHFGMIERWACLAGCAVKVACVGAVATYEEYRGRGLATKLFEAACDKALGDGVDFMMISGGRGLYRRANAADVGCDFAAEITVDAAERFSDSGVSVAEFQESDLPDCVAAYDKKPTRFIRPSEDWQWFLQSRYCMDRDSRFVVIRKGDLFAGYVIFSVPDKEQKSSIAEFGGEERVIAQALHTIMSQYNVSVFNLYLQGDDMTFKSILEANAVILKPDVTSGTLLLINLQQLIERLQPYIESKMEPNAARKFSIAVSGETYKFCTNADEFVINGKMEVEEFIFGNARKPRIESPFNDLFPVPTLRYGINFV